GRVVVAAVGVRVGWRAAAAGRGDEGEGCAEHEQWRSGGRVHGRSTPDAWRGRGLELCCDQLGEDGAHLFPGGAGVEEADGVAAGAEDRDSLPVDRKSVVEGKGRG